MDRANLWRASLLMAALIAACGQEPTSPEQPSSLAAREDAVFSGNTVLILDSTVVGAELSEEAQAVGRLGYQPAVVNAETWAGMTADQFASHRAIILGDAGCANPAALAAAVANRHVWGPVINGNVLISGAAPVHNGAPVLVTERSIRFAAQKSGLTGFYAALGCYYQDAEPSTHVELLEPFGTFSVQSGGCHDSTHIVSSHSILNALTDETMSNWGCSVGAAFDSFPEANFAPWSIAMYDPSEQGVLGDESTSEFVDGTFGRPYILARGVTLLGCGDGELQLDEQCDYGYEVNGMLGGECSATCRLNWCGDGVVDVEQGEACDLGSQNGYGECPRSCRLVPAPPPPPPPAHQPPVALCRHVTVPTPAEACGAEGLIDDGSYDEDGDLVGCTQDVVAFGLGQHSATLLCTDARGLSSSCTATVTVVDTSAPQISCPAATSFECGMSGVSPEHDPATATDNCQSSPFVTYLMEGQSYAVGAARTVTWLASDGANEATCDTSITMVDTKAPSLALNGAASLALECGVGQYAEAGAVASDLCAGDLTDAIAKTGAVNAAARGAYEVNYRVEDASGNAATAVRTVSVNDTLAPSITLVGAASLALECGVDSFSNPGATAMDACSGNLTDAIVKTGAVNTAAVGSYTLGYSVQDGAGLSASATRTVQVADTQAPSLALNGAATLALECGLSQYTEAGAVASDVCTGSLTSAIVKTGAVNTAVRSVYTVNYRVEDASGNAATAARTVTVNDTKAPSIALVGAASMSVTRGTAFTDPGATATDACSGNLTGAIVKTGAVNTAVPGTYTLTYRVQDAVGLAASVTRTVTVADSCTTTVTVKPTQEIWPPNHKYQSFTLSDCASVTTTCGGGGDSNGHGNNAIDTMGKILSIYSDEVEDASGNGDGNTDDDIVITGDSSFKLRAERQGKGNGRVYGVRFKVTDSTGAEQTGTCKFVVPHDQSGRGGIDDGAGAGYTVYATP